MSNCIKARNGISKVSQLQRILYLKSKQEVNYKFYSLYDKVYRTDVLQEAWRQVKANKGAAGNDGVTIEQIITTGYEEEMIRELQQGLKDQSYKFSSIRQVAIPKPKGGTRLLGIATVKDRIVQTAMKIVIEPIFEADFHDCSYGYRPKRNAKQASLAIREDLYDRAATVVEIDFESYFDSIPHGNLLILIKQRISDGAMLRLIKQSLKVDIDKSGNQKRVKIGVPQGSPISPLYSNIYLNLIDQIWHKMQYPWKLHRFADDVVLVCQRDGYKALKKFQEITERLSLKLNQSKTKVTRLIEGFDFVGFNFIKRQSPTSGKNTIYIFPAKSSEQKIRNSIKYKTSWRAPIQPEEFVEQINTMVRGWSNYYLHTNASQAFRKLQRFINIRFRRYLHRRRKGHGYGWQHYPNSKLYTKGIIYIGSGMLEHIRKPVNDLR
ncbi:group II intron reverse transcriptase/maturase [Candidatus Trichorickettsia mobilis]|uniref:group II intron reverse transcriptase/maturase n=1 Tax=Candidatus Trichorickettsia mobilis TaxID=1346319 RepID=UPI002931AC18|nr:group II intron reverse transcriptase/maturase [Candidatus Trichorickettsia mobilis]